MAAGSISAIISTPTDLVLTRMQSDNSSINEIKYRYKNVFNGLYQIYNTTGIFSLWKGGGIIVPRAMVINGTLFPSYYHSKKILSEVYGENSDIVRIVPSIVAGLSSATVSQPFDIIKTHIQSDKTYNNDKIRTILFNIISQNGIVGLYRGFPIYITRIAPHGIITTYIMDNLLRI